MKKITAIAFASIMMFVSGCGNMDIMDWHWRFDKALIKMSDDKWHEIKVQRWHDYEKSDMIAVETDDNVYVTHSMNVILIKIK